MGEALEGGEAGNSDRPPQERCDVQPYQVDWQPWPSPNLTRGGVQRDGSAAWCGSKIVRLVRSACSVAAKASS
jgi:hypothetical protein